MAKNSSLVEFFKGFSKLKVSERFQRLMDMNVVSKKDVQFLQSGGVKGLELANNFIENSIGYFQLPMGVVTNLHIDGRDVVVPMAVEETSIIAACSKTARWIRESGTLNTEVIGSDIIGQIQIAHVKNYEALKQVVSDKKEEWIKDLNANPASGMFQRGGGVTDIRTRLLERPDEGFMAVIHVHLNPCDAMGANVINQVCEYLTTPVEEVTGEKVTMRILSNLVDTKITRATIVLKDVEEELGRGIQEASVFAETDPYRAATNNKGVLNGIDPILIATGNDWRAVEAGMHAYASRKGHYSSITRWRFEKGTLTGTLEAPIICGTVGGVTQLHPTAKMSLRMMGVEQANELSKICAAVGLVQNLGAIKALTTEGIIEGHMKLHIKNLALSAGAKTNEQAPLQSLLEQLLKARKRITMTDAVSVLKKLRESMKDSVKEAKPISK